jgi:hypothetical protein
LSVARERDALAVRVLDALGCYGNQVAVDVLDLINPAIVETVFGALFGRYTNLRLWD